MEWPISKTSYKKHKDKGAYFYTAQSKSGVKWFDQAESRVGCFHHIRESVHLCLEWHAANI